MSYNTFASASSIETSYFSLSEIKPLGLGHRVVCRRSLSPCDLVSFPSGTDAYQRPPPLTWKPNQGTGFVVDPRLSSDASPPDVSHRARHSVVEQTKRFRVLVNWVTQSRVKVEALYLPSMRMCPASINTSCAAARDSFSPCK